MKRYSIVILPSTGVISFFKSVKEALFQLVGKYKSKDSIAHVTLAEFECDGNQLVKICAKVRQFADSRSILTVTFDEVGIYPNGSFLLAANPESKKLLKKMFKGLHQLIGVKILSGSFNPHISFGLNMNPKQMIEVRKAYSNFQYDATFGFENIYLRELDENMKQFVIIETFPLNGNETQFRLF